MADTSLVATITKLSDNNYIGHGSATFQLGTYSAKTYSECKKFFETAAGRKLNEVESQTEGGPEIVYLKVPGS